MQPLTIACSVKYNTRYSTGSHQCSSVACHMSDHREDTRQGMEQVSASGDTTFMDLEIAMHCVGERTGHRSSLRQDQCAACERRGEAVVPGVLLDHKEGRRVEAEARRYASRPARSIVAASLT